MKIIDRLIQHNWVRQTDSVLDKRSKLIEITDAGNLALAAIIEDVRLASKIVVADLNQGEKFSLIKMLQKLDTFHNPIFAQTIDSGDLLQVVKNNYSIN
jgi:DNA-binding MarR family transcriptional regulator